MQPQPYDLVTLESANEWIFGQNPKATPNNFVLQMAISSLSLDFLRRTGRAAQNGTVPTASPFNQPITYTESYTGNGNQMIQLRNFPILSVSSVTVNGQPLQQSTAPTMPGYFISDDGAFLCIRGGATQPYTRAGAFGWGTGFYSGLGSVGWPKNIDGIVVTYEAGFATVPYTNELQTIPAQPSAWQASTNYSAGMVIFDGTNVQICTMAQSGVLSGVSSTVAPSQWNPEVGGYTKDGPTIIWENIGPPFTVTVNNLPWISDAGVLYFSNGTALTLVTTAPAEGEYYLSGNGVYLFNSADAGKQVQISYDSAGTPVDIQESILRWVNLIYQRRGWEGLRSVSNKDGGSTVYTAWEIDPSVRKMIDFYMRRA